MIKQEFLDDGRVRTWSTKGYQIRNIENGDTFESALDMVEWNCQYEEVIPEETNEGKEADNVND